MSLTLDQIVANSLEQIGHSDDAQKTSEWQSQFYAYANDAQRDLAKHVRMKRTDTVQVADSVILRANIPFEVVKVSSIKVGGTVCAFTAPDSKSINVSGISTGTATITYEYMPKDMVDGQEYPDIPASLHAAIPIYIAYRYYMTRDQSKAAMFKIEYDNLKKNANGSIGGSDQYSLLNVFS